MNIELNYWAVPGLIEHPRLRASGPELIIEQVCAVYQLSEEAIRRKTRKPVIVEARQISMVLIRTYCPKLTLKCIAELFAPATRDHTTVIHAQQAVEGHLENEMEYRARYGRCVIAVRQILTYEPLDK